MGADSFCGVCTATLKEIDDSINSISSKTVDLDTKVIGVTTRVRKITMCRCASFEHLCATFITTFENLACKTGKELTFFRMIDYLTRDAFRGYVMKLQDPKLTEDAFMEFVSQLACSAQGALKDLSYSETFLAYMKMLRSTERAAQLEAELTNAKAEKDALTKELEELKAKCATIINGCGNC